MVVTVHAGHAAPGNKYTGATGYCAESYVDREVKNALINILRADGHTVHDCTVDKGLSQSNIITQIKKKINAVPAAHCNISIHLNAYKKTAKDGKTKGVECCVYSNSNKGPATAICQEVSKLGFTNRGVKARTDLGVLKGINNGGHNVLIECFFCDDEDDYIIYRNLGANAIAKSIVAGLYSFYGVKKSSNTPSKTWVHKGFDYTHVFDPVFYGNHNADVAKAYNSNQTQMFNHFISYGMKEGRQACENFNVNVYKERYPDLKNAFGSDLPSYYRHYCTYGYAEGRNAI